MRFRSGWEAVIIMAGGFFLPVLMESRELSSSGSPGQISPIYFKYIQYSCLYSFVQHSYFEVSSGCDVILSYSPMSMVGTLYSESLPVNYSLCEKEEPR